MSMYRLMLLYLAALVAAALVLSLLDILPFSPLDILLSSAVLVGSVTLATRLLDRLFKVPVNPESSIITGLILTLIVGPLSIGTSFWQLVFVGLLAGASKFVLNWKGRHIFNPAAAAVLASAFLGGVGASWWVGMPELLPLVAVGGVLVLRKIHFAHLVAAFLATYFVMFAILSGVGNIPTLILNSSLLFFVFVMLVEPLTAPVSQKLRIAYGVFIALALVVMQELLPDFPYSLEASLLIGNLAFRFVSSSQKIILLLVGKEKVAEETVAFQFDPKLPLKFEAGQFLEWTVVHPWADSRGSRRYFTIASSPTEKQLMLTTKLADPSSSFKQALMELKPGEIITATGPQGEFTLLPDKSQALAFIAGGIGVTPFRSMIKYLLDTGERRDIALLYANRSPEHVAFKDLFTEAEKIGVKTIYEYSPVDDKLVAERIPDWRTRVFYISGPEPMVQAVEKTLKGMGLPRAQIKRDYFPGYEVI